MDTETLDRPADLQIDPIPTVAKPARINSTVAGGAVTPTPRNKRVSSISPSPTGSIITVDGIAYPMSDVPATLHAELATQRVRHILMTSDDPAATFALLVSGKTPGKAPAKPKELDHRRMAIALADADKLAKERGVKPKSDDYRLILDDTKQRAAGLSGAEVKIEHKRLSVMTHYARLTGVAD